MAEYEEKEQARKDELGSLETHAKTVDYYDYDSEKRRVLEGKVLRYRTSILEADFQEIKASIIRKLSSLRAGIFKKGKIAKLVERAKAAERNRALDQIEREAYRLDKKEYGAPLDIRYEERHGRRRL